MLGLYVPPSVDPAIAAALEKFAEYMVGVVADAYADHRRYPAGPDDYPRPTPEEEELAEADVTYALQEFLRG